MEPGSAGEGYNDRLAVELARIREAIDDLRRRPIPLDAANLRHVVTASLSEASAPPPNLLVTAIRRLDRVDARLESIEAALGGPVALPRGGQPVPAAGGGRGRAPAVAPPGAVGYSPPLDPEAIADALARRLAGVLSSQVAAVPGGGATIDDLLAALRPLVPGAARAVLRRAGREPSPQAVEVLQQTALGALEEAAASLGPYAAPADPRWLPGPPAALAPAPPPPPAPPLAPRPEPPVDVEALAAAITSRVTAAVVAQLPPPAAAPQPPPRPERPDPPPPPPPPPPPVDPAEVADAVLNRLAEQPPPQAVLSAMAMAPLLSAVGNVEAAVARLAEPETDVAVAVGRLQAGIEALIHALEQDRAVQDDMRQGFAEVTELVRAELAAKAGAAATGGTEATSTYDRTVLAASDQDDVEALRPGLEGLQTAVTGMQRHLDRLSNELEPLTQVELGSLMPDLVAQGQRLERSMGDILTALAAVAEHLQEQSTVWRSRFEELRGATGAAAPAGAAEAVGGELGDLARRVDELVAATAADRQRFQRLGGTIDGLAALLGQVSERLDRLPRVLGRPLPVEPAGSAAGGLGHHPLDHAGIDTVVPTPPPALDATADDDHPRGDPAVAGTAGPAAPSDPPAAEPELDPDEDLGLSSDVDPRRGLEDADERLPVSGDGRDAAGPEPGGVPDTDARAQGFGAPHEVEAEVEVQPDAADAADAAEHVTAAVAVAEGEVEADSATTLLTETETDASAQDLGTPDEAEVGGSDDFGATDDEADDSVAGKPAEAVGTGRRRRRGRRRRA